MRRHQVRELQRQGNASLVMALTGNKADLAEKRKVDTEEAQAYADENGLFFMETSAKTASNVNGVWLSCASPAAAACLLTRPALSELFYEIARKLPKQAPVTQPSGGLVLTDKAPLKKKSNCC